MPTRRRGRLVVEIVVALTPGLVLAAIGFWCLQWAADHEQRDNQRNWAVAVGIVFLALGLAISTVSAVVMAVYGWREVRHHEEDGDG